MVCVGDMLRRTTGDVGWSMSGNFTFASTALSCVVCRCVAFALKEFCSESSAM